MRKSLGKFKVNYKLDNMFLSLIKSIINYSLRDLFYYICL
jgi:hypothetical protein